MPCSLPFAGHRIGGRGSAAGLWWPTPTLGRLPDLRPSLGCPARLPAARAAPRSSAPLDLEHRAAQGSPARARKRSAPALLRPARALIRPVWLAARLLARHSARRFRASGLLVPRTPTALHHSRSGRDSSAQGRQLPGLAHDPSTARRFRASAWRANNAPQAPALQHAR